MTHSFISIFYKIHPSKSHTVNASWFITKTYLANYYYTILHDTNTVLATCQEIQQIYKQSSCDGRVADNTLQVIVSTDWTECYHQQIQPLLGFYALTMHMLGGETSDSSMSVSIPVCPVMFALYLTCRCCFELAYKGQGQWFVQFLSTATTLNEHAQNCQSSTKAETQFTWTALILFFADLTLTFSKQLFASV